MGLMQTSVTQLNDDVSFTISSRPLFRCSTKENASESPLNFIRPNKSNVSESIFDKEDAGYSPSIVPSKTLSEDKLVTESQSKIKGVITAINNDITFITLQLPNNEQTEITIPQCILPESLKNLATPVWVTLDDSSGYERIVFSKREDVAPLENSDELQNIDRWINNL